VARKKIKGNFGYDAHAVTEGMMRHFRLEANKVITRLETAEGLTDPNRGVSLNLIGVTTRTVDRRRFSAGKINVIDGLDFVIDMRGIYQFSEKVEEMQKRFSREFYTRVRKAYRGTGMAVTPRLKSSTIDIRRSRGISRTTPYYETGMFLRNGIKHDVQKHVVYLSRATHPPRPGEEKSLTYAQIYYLNEYGYPDYSIPPRPVWRPLARKILAAYEKELYVYINKFIT